MENPSNRFARYEEGFYSAIKMISRNTEALNGSDVNNIIRLTVEAEDCLAESEANVVAMQIEANSMPAGVKPRFTEKTKEFQLLYDETNDKFKKAKKRAEQIALMNDSSGSSQRGKLLNTNKKLDHSSFLIQDSMKMVEDSNTKGDQIMSDLSNQRDVLRNAQTKVEDTRGITDKARDLLKYISNRALKHKICIGVLIVALLGVNIGMIYYLIHKDDKNNNDNDTSSA